MNTSTKAEKNNIFFDFSINLNHNEFGKLLDANSFNLLEMIHETGSLKKTADNLELSYRKVWSGVEEMESALGFKLVRRVRNEDAGGNTSLTPKAINIVETFKDLKMQFSNSIQEVNQKLSK